MMAAASLFGFLYKQTFLGMSDQAWSFWLVAVPVVIVGAPAGAWLVRNRSRRFIARLLIGSILLQFLGAIWIIPITLPLAVFSLVAWAAGLVLFQFMDYQGRHRFQSV